MDLIESKLKIRSSKIVDDLIESKLKVVRSRLQLGKLLLEVLLYGVHEVLGVQEHALLNVGQTVNATSQVLGHLATVHCVDAGSLQSNAEPEIENSIKKPFLLLSRPKRLCRLSKNDNFFEEIVEIPVGFVEFHVEIVEIPTENDAFVAEIVNFTFEIVEIHVEIVDFAS